MIILIADDHIIFREGLASLLKKIPFIKSVLQAGNGRETIDMVRQQQVDVVLMDIEMPEMNGIQATKIIKSTMSDDIAVIALTMFNRYSDVVNLYDTGVNGYLLKDTSIVEITKALSLINEGKEYYCDAVKEVLFNVLVQRQKNINQPVTDELTEREKEVLLLICEQNSTEEIAKVLFISPLTVNNHRRNILQKTKAKNVAGLVVYALLKGIYHLPHHKME